MRTLNDQEMQQVAGGFFLCLPKLVLSKLTLCLPKLSHPKPAPKPAPKPPVCEPKPPVCEPKTKC